MTENAAAAQADVAEDATLDTKDDFCSVTITLDHLRHVGATDGRVVVPMFFGTDTAQEALVNQLQYFGEMNLMAKRSVIAKVHEIGLKACVISYEVQSRPQTNIICDIKLFQAAMSDERLGGDGTVMGAVRTLTELAADLSRNARKAKDTDPIQVYVSGDLAN